MIQTKLRISIVIPVYNEEDHITDCLQAISRQTVKPYEVLVVDNNSTDQTVLLAERFPFVRVITARRQGVVHARNRGFNAARGDVIGRIDADTIVPKNWVATIDSIFATNTDVDAVSGAVSYHDFPYAPVATRIDLYFRQQIAEQMGQQVFLYGANMAIRRSAWKAARASTCLRGGLHEDFDLAIHAYDHALNVAFDPRLKAAVSLRRVDVTITEFWDYVLLSPQTYKQHGRTVQRAMYPALVLSVGSFWLLKIIHRAYDPALGRMSARKLFQDTYTRVNPATYVD